jgi:hypothetical protein
MKKKGIMNSMQVGRVVRKGMLSLAPKVINLIRQSKANVDNGRYELYKPHKEQKHQNRNLI